MKDRRSRTETNMRTERWPTGSWSSEQRLKESEGWRGERETGVFVPRAGSRRLVPHFAVGLTAAASWELHLLPEKWYVWTWNFRYMNTNKQSQNTRPKAIGTNQLYTCCCCCGGNKTKCVTGLTGRHWSYKHVQYNYTVSHSLHKRSLAEMLRMIWRKI